MARSSVCHMEQHSWRASAVPWWPAWGCPGEHCTARGCQGSFATGSQTIPDGFEGPQILAASQQGSLQTGLFFLCQMWALDRHPSVSSLQALRRHFQSGHFHLRLLFGDCHPGARSVNLGWEKELWLPELCFSPGYSGLESGLAHHFNILFLQHVPLTIVFSTFLPRQFVSIMWPKCKFLPDNTEEGVPSTLLEFFSPEISEVPLRGFRSRAPHKHEFWTWKKKLLYLQLYFALEEFV